MKNFEFQKMDDRFKEYINNTEIENLVTSYFLLVHDLGLSDARDLDIEEICSKEREEHVECIDYIEERIIKLSK